MSCPTPLFFRKHRKQNSLLLLLKLPHGPVLPKVDPCICCQWITMMMMMIALTHVVTNRKSYNTPSLWAICLKQLGKFISNQNRDNSLPLGILPNTVHAMRCADAFCILCCLSSQLSRTESALWEHDDLLHGALTSPTMYILPHTENELCPSVEVGWCLGRLS